MDAEEQAQSRPWVEWISAMLSGEPAALLGDAGFRSSGLEFTRNLDGMTQNVSFSVVETPVHARGYWQLVGHVDLVLPTAEQIYHSMMESASDLRSGRPMRRPFDALRDRPGATWLFRDAASARDLERPVARALVDYVLPYCELTHDYAGVLEWCRREVDRALDLLERMGRQPDLIGPGAVFAAAVGIAVGEKVLAREILDRAYPQDSKSRTRYSSAFTFAFS
ncbi:MAG: hypothetical protein IRY85_22680 [Micromonosporaceae bacterium]|nr:hypothetical protein [Micromonosporaceae bacterium]